MTSLSDAGLDPELRACAVCARVLEQLDGEYVHILAGFAPEFDEHVPVPVLVNEIKTEWHCDFCYSTEVHAILPVGNFQMPHDSTQGSLGNWNACSVCAGLIRKDHWRDLAKRAADSIFARHPGERFDRTKTRASIVATYEELRRHVTGPLREFPAELRR